MTANNISTILAPPAAVPVEAKTNEKASIDNAENLKSVIDQPEQASDLINSLSVNGTIKIIGELNELMEDLQTNLGFYIREDLNHQIVIEIKDRSTDELIRQIPSEEMLLIREKMVELNGLIFDQEA